MSPKKPTKSEKKRTMAEIEGELARLIDGGEKLRAESRRLRRVTGKVLDHAERVRRSLAKLRR
jgi:hypothetical protein